LEATVPTPLSTRHALPGADLLNSVEAAIAAAAADLLDSSAPLVLGEEASCLMARLRRADPAAWDAWSTTIAHEVVMGRLRSHLARLRSAAVRGERAEARRSVFGLVASDAREAAADGTPPPSPFSARYALPGGRSWLSLGEMTKGDLLAVASHRRSLARSNYRESIFLSALAYRLPNEETTVASALSEQEVLAIHAQAEGADLPEPSP